MTDPTDLSDLVANVEQDGSAEFAAPCLDRNDCGAADDLKCSGIELDGRVRIGEDPFGNLPGIRRIGHIEQTEF